ncbi:uncharacterized protein [Temnothorax nylanderi]|uniref:uncharacterized protein n=1 Tax=Temnothorax nylanderi TaxID=102681 RepID=UPI003A83AEE3
MSLDAEGALRSQHDLYGRISRIMENLRKLGEAKITPGMVESRIELLDSYWTKFHTVHDTLLTTFWSAVKEHEYVKSDFVGKAEEAYMTQRSMLVDMRKESRGQLGHASAIRGHEGESSPRKSLPRIQLPTFTGRYDEWSAFKDLFGSIIDQDTGLSNVEKLHYLKSCVKGEAEQLLKNLPTTADNYKRAVTLLTGRYDNKRLLVRACFSALTALPKLKDKSVPGLRRLFHTMIQTVSSLESIGRPVDNSSDLFVHILVELLDPSSRREWENSISNSTDPPAYAELKSFMECRLRALEALHPSGRESSTTGKANGVNPQTKRTHFAQKSTASGTTAPGTTASGTTAGSNRGNPQARRAQPARRQPGSGRCSLCEKEHYITGCGMFQEKSPTQKKEFVESKGLCYNCLGEHFASSCPSKKTCGVCNERHHTTIHDVCQRRNDATGASTSSLHASKFGGDRAVILLATARVSIMDRYGNQVSARALIDSGSEVSLAAESLVQRLHLPRSPASIVIFGVGGSKTGSSKGKVDLKVTSQATEAAIRVTALVLPRITIYGERINWGKAAWPHLDDLQLADPDFRARDPVEILLGAEIYAAILEDGVRKGEPYTPVAQRTTLGWILSGAVKDTGPRGPAISHHCSIGEDLSALVRQFWEQEEPTRAPLPLTETEQQCDDLFKKTHSRTEDGRYMVRLPVAPTLPRLDETKQIAERTLKGMERKFESDGRLYVLYANFLKDYEVLQHMTPVPQSCELKQTRTCYLPHHGVLKAAGDEVKIRVVFNGSAQLTSGDSLNRHLYTGPNLLPTLGTILTRWRQHQFVMVTDIAKMYRQILVHPDDRDLQRILWRKDRAEAVQEYRLNTVTYGLSCAPYLAIRTLHQLAADEGHRFPLGAAVLEHDTYVDDIFAGDDSKEGARGLRNQLIEICTAGGFPLSKWAANDEDLLRDIPEDRRQSRSLREWESDVGHSTLGIQWRPCLDAFAFKVRPCGEGNITKRIVLSETARLFDPLGWLAPVVVRAKILIQSLWLQRIEWDQPLCPEDHRARQLFRRELPLLEKLRVPRWLNTGGENLRMEIHGFADASERAIAAVAYLKVTNDCESKISLLQAKTRVAPLRQVSLPRLELCAAALLVKIIEDVEITLDLSGAQKHLWSDSKVALAWIQGHPSKWKTYVANRVAEIQRALPDAIWHHIPSEENPADCASRGLSPSELLQHHLWWQGPIWLQSRDKLYSQILPEEIGDLPEQRTHVHLASKDPEEDPNLLRFSGFQRLLRVTAWGLRWLNVLQSRHKQFVTGTLTPQELEDAEQRWIRVVQKAWFADELHALARGQALSRRSSILKMHPIIDEKGMLRVGGRLKHAILSRDERHPVILPRHSHLTNLIVDAYHRRALHGGVQLTLGLLRQRFWIPGGRMKVRQHIHRCVRCVRWRAASPHPLMGDLPRPRVRASRPFTHTGVDYAGPILLRTTKGRGQKAHKGFLVIFVCLSTRAVHLEVASDYTAEAFIAAYKRFESRRGLCTALYSDQGTNFIGADAQLRALFLDAIRDHSIANTLANDGVQWRFNPPSAPHFGGIWEAAVKSTKHHLRRVIGDATLTYEELSTFLTQVEACLNSRPLSPLSDDSEDLAALTPGHFLIGAAISAVPEPSLAEEPTGRLSRWQLLQQLRDHFWKRWSSEYLQALNSRQKWWTKHDNPRVGDLCLVRGEQTAPTKWPLARVTAIHPGEDEQVRVVTIRTAATTLKRPTTKIILLPRVGDPEDI